MRTTAEITGARPPPGIVLGRRPSLVLLRFHDRLGGQSCAVQLSRPPAAAGRCIADPRNATLTIAYSPEKAALIKSLADKFNAKHERTPDGQSMQVALVELTPEEMVNQALAGGILPGAEPGFVALARPAQPRAGRKASRPSPATSRRDWPAIRCAIAITPIVIAAWENTARQLGWPDKPVSWHSLADPGAERPELQVEPSQHGVRQRPAGHAGRVLRRRRRAARPDRRDGAGARRRWILSPTSRRRCALRRGRAADDRSAWPRKAPASWTPSSSPSSWWWPSTPARSANRRRAWSPFTRPRARCGPTTRWPCWRRPR